MKGQMAVVFDVHANAVRADGGGLLRESRQGSRETCREKGEIEET